MAAFLSLLAVFLSTGGLALGQPAPSDARHQGERLGAYVARLSAVVANEFHPKSENSPLHAAPSGCGITSNLDGSTAANATVTWQLGCEPGHVAILPDFKCTAVTSKNYVQWNVLEQLHGPGPWVQDQRFIIVSTPTFYDHSEGCYPSDTCSYECGCCGPSSGALAAVITAGQLLYDLEPHCDDHLLHELGEVQPFAMALLDVLEQQDVKVCDAIKVLYPADLDAILLRWSFGLTSTRSWPGAAKAFLLAAAIAFFMFS